MDDPRGNLTLTFLGLLARYNPRWFVWENVPCVFSSITHAQSDFGCFLSALAELGYSCAYRVLDAKYFGVPQRRRRIFVVGHLGSDWRPPFAVLFEPESLRGNIKTRREAEKESDEDVKGRTYWEGGEIHPPLTQALKSSGGVGMSNQEIFNQKGAYLVMAHGQGNAEICKDGNPSLTCNHEAPILAVHARQDPITVEDKSLPLDVKGNTQAVAIQDARGMDKKQHGLGITEDGPAYTVDTIGGQGVGTGSIVRRLTPMECERLQGFPDGYTLIPYKGKPATDGPRYKALGNSMARPVVEWIGRRIQMWEGIF